MYRKKIMQAYSSSRIKRLAARLQVTALVALFGLAGGYSSPSSAMLLNIPDLPLFVGVDIAPNVFLEIDDSGSMDWEVLTSEHFMYCSYIPSPDNGATCTNFQHSDTMVFPRLNGFTLRAWLYYSDTNDNTLNESCQDFQEPTIQYAAAWPMATTRSSMNGGFFHPITILCTSIRMLTINPGLDLPTPVLMPPDPIQSQAAPVLLTSPI